MANDSASSSIVQIKMRRNQLHTPLRYPGGKTSLFNFFEKVIEKHGWQDVTYIEPYAGGAGAALSLLISGKVSSIVINDYDFAIYSFWQNILEETDRFIETIRTTPVTIEEWERQKQVYKTCDEAKPFELGFATFYLNRTNRSGILSAGPVGGKSQGGLWKLDARYNKQKMIEKIRLISLYKESITVTNDDGVNTIRKYSEVPNTFFYVDPPYYLKGAILYLNSFTHEKHQELADTLNEHADKKWLLSYDNVDPIKDMYMAHGFEPEIFSLSYSAHAKTRVGSEIMVFSEAIDKELLRD